MINKFLLLLNTVKYLKFKQVYFQVIYKLKPGKNLNHYVESIRFNIKKLNFIDFSTPVYADGNGKFTFLNLEKTFNYKIDWNFNEYGKLWNYNLQYLHFLSQDNLQISYKLKVVNDIHAELYSGKLKLEPYPTSLRIINLIRFLCKNSGEIDSNTELEIQKAVLAQTKYLYHNLEYHILGNHLLENAFALLISAEYFNIGNWKEKAEKLLFSELEEQILDDGAHFELSPMYHQIILSRILEAISYLNENLLKEFLKQKAADMLAWLQLVTFKNGDIPHFNDSSNNITYTTNELINCARSIRIEEKKLHQFSDSGYRKFSNDDFEIIVDVNGIQPSYQPGHAHADHQSFVLYYKNHPIIVDPGISTYNISKRRDWERSSMAHNTITVDNMNQSQVWGGFRVAKRAIVESIVDSENAVKAKIMYSIKNKNVQHERSLTIQNIKILIDDSIDVSGVSGIISRYYLHPHIKSISVNKNNVILDDRLQLIFKGELEINVSEYQFSLGYNRLELANVIEVKLDRALSLEILPL